MTSSPSQQENNDNINSTDEIDDWEEWDGSSPFLYHCVAGSIAGVAEHTLLYPIDTVKTHMQTYYCMSCPKNKAFKNSKFNTAGATTTMRTPASTPASMWHIMRQITLVESGASGSAGRMESSLAALGPPKTSTSYLRLWRGVQSMVIGCIPAHALYFSSYESIKHWTASQCPPSGNPWFSLAASSVAGAVATISHDLIMGPLDTLKQRMQLGQLDSRVGVAFRQVYSKEGFWGLYRSFPITLATNVPYGMIVVSVNEFLKSQLQKRQEPPNQKLSVSGYLLAGSGAGMLAAAITTPLDRVKTRLQTQVSAFDGPRISMQELSCATHERRCEKTPAVRNWQHALRLIVKEEGYAGLLRGMTPRVLTHTPSMAISWTTYEAAKQYLESSDYF